MRRLYVLPLFAILAAAAARADETAKEDLSTFKQYLAKNHPGKKWQTGPAVLSSPELQKAYPGQRFCYVFSAPPLPPGAFLPELVERYRRELEDFQKNYISLTVSLDNDSVRPLGRAAEDYNHGLMKVASAEDAKVAAAAILSLYAGTAQGTGPTIVRAEEVNVSKTDTGWTCGVTRKDAFIGTVVFTAAGQCERISKTSIAPLPPSSPPSR